ncbi:winged helix-turn-helix transcriptional regulator [Nocardia sp. NPDC002869]|uniref:winged helix-turn-helix transcriptional regulator n=1 Tax=Nocardia sp. NPDC002869 TaxID=3161032 RepID=UPI00398D25BF
MAVQRMARSLSALITRTARQPYREEGKRTRHEYVLTAKGRDLLPVVPALMQWGNTHLQPGPLPLDLVEAATGDPVRVQVRSESGREIGVDDLGVRLNEQWRATRRRAAGSAATDQP